MDAIQSLFIQYGWAICAALLVVILAFAGWIASLQRQIRRIQQHTNVIFRDANGNNLEEIFNKHIDNIYQNQAQLDQLAACTAELQATLQKCLRHVGYVRFDPFMNGGGDQSYALALLDDRRDGLVFLSLHTRTGTRIYAKPVQAGQSTYPLSEEEIEAIQQATQIPVPAGK